LERKYAKEIGEIKKEYKFYRKYYDIYNEAYNKQSKLISKYYDLYNEAYNKKSKLINKLGKKTDYKSTIDDNGRITANIDLYGKIDSIVNEILFTLQYRDNIDLAMIEKLTDAITEKELGKIRKP
jgi:hypothetical protein